MNNTSGFAPLVSTLSEHKDTIADVVDLGLEASESIPFVGWAVKLWRIKETYQEHLLKRNVKAFLQYSTIDDINEFVNKFETEEDKQDFADTVAQVLLNSEKPIKGSIISNVINSLSAGKITVKEAGDMNLVILNSSIPALKALHDFFKENPTGYTNTLSKSANTLAPLLMSMGVLYVHGNMTRVSSIGTKINEFGIGNIIFN